MKQKVVAFGKFIKRNKPVKFVGLDTNLIYAWITNEEYYGTYRPKFCKQGERLFISFKVFGELLGLVKSKMKSTINDAKDHIFTFLRKNKIQLLKKKNLDIEKYQSTLKELKHKFRDIHDEDLEVIASFHAFIIDTIFSSNARHFQKPCEHLGINFEKHFEVEVGSEQDVRNMLKGINEFRRKRIC